MTPFGIFTCATLLIALVSGVAIGAFAVSIGDPALAWLAGGVTFAPIFLIMGRIWLRGEIDALSASERNEKPNG